MKTYLLAGAFMSGLVTATVLAWRREDARAQEAADWLAAQQPPKRHLRSV